MLNRKLTISIAELSKLSLSNNNNNENNSKHIIAFILLDTLHISCTQ